MVVATVFIDRTDYVQQLDQDLQLNMSKSELFSQFPSEVISTRLLKCEGECEGRSFTPYGNYY